VALYHISGVVLGPISGAFVCASTKRSQKSRRDAGVTEWRLCGYRKARSAWAVPSARIEEWAALRQAMLEGTASRCSKALGSRHC